MTKLEKEVYNFIKEKSDPESMTCVDIDDLSVELNITIETQDELIDLIKRLNLSKSIINRADKDYPDVDNHNFQDLWEELDNIYEYHLGLERGI